MTFLNTRLIPIGYVKSEVTDVSIPLKDNDLQIDMQVQSRQVSTTSISKIVIDY